MENQPQTLVEYVLAILRNALMAFGATLVTKGAMTATQSEAIVGGILAGIALIWSLVAKKIAAKKLQKAIDAPAGKAE